MICSCGGGEYTPVGWNLDLILVASTLEIDSRLVLVFVQLPWKFKRTPCSKIQ
jgi:hypothetical protein